MAGEIEQSKNKPAIRTMRSDVEDILKEGASGFLARMAEGEAERRKTAPAGGAQKRVPYRAAILAVLIAAIAGIGGYLFLRSGGETTAPPPRLVPPAPYFATESSRTISADTADRRLFLELMEDASRERERAGTIKRILIRVKDGPSERYATLDDLFSAYDVAPPPSLFEVTRGSPMTFFSYGEEGARFGLAAETRDGDRAFAAMLSWESTLLRDFLPFFFGERPERVLSPFEDRTYRNIDWRYLKLAQDKDIGIGYAVFPAGNILIITTGKEPMERAIDRLFAAR